MSVLVGSKLVGGRNTPLSDSETRRVSQNVGRLGSQSGALPGVTPRSLGAGLYRPTHHGKGGSPPSERFTQSQIPVPPAKLPAPDPSAPISLSVLGLAARLVSRPQRSSGAPVDFVPLVR
jgi:hypothetical protein